MPDPLRTDLLHRYEWDVDCALRAFRRASETATTMDELIALGKRLQALEHQVTGTLDYVRIRADRLEHFADCLRVAK